jgi:hypothetical protein
MDTKVPRYPNAAIAALSRAVAPESTPVFVACRPVEGGPVDECFPIVECYARENGGSPCVGCTLWEWPGILVEAEFHAVWCSPSGDLIDIVPRLVPLDRVLFLPDPKREYVGTQVDNVRRPLTADPHAHELIELCERRFALMNRGARARQHGLIQLQGEEAKEWRMIAKRSEDVMRAIRRSVVSPRRNDPCYCGSRKKFKNCCGP